MPALKNPQYDRFACELAELKPAIEAYKAAGFTPHRGNANRLAKRPEIQARVRELIEEAAEFSDIRRSRVLVEIDRVGRANLIDFFERVCVGKDEKGAERYEIRLRDITQLPRHLTAALAGLEWDETGRPKIKLHDKNQANFALLKYLGALPGDDGDRRGDTNIFNLLTLEDQRALAAALENLPGGTGGNRPAIEGERQPA